MAPEPNLRDRNLSSVFDLCDTDQDGYITEADLSATGRRAMDELGITDGQQWAEILAMYQPAWEQLRASLLPAAVRPYRRTGWPR